MEKLSAKKKNMIIRLYLSGLSYDEIAAKAGVSKGSVANVINDLKAGKIPEAADVGEQIELLRDLSLELRRSRLTPGQCAVGLSILSRINDCGLSPADIDRWPLILTSVGSEEQAQEFVRIIYDIQEVQKSTGLSLEELDDKVHDLERKAAKLEPMSKQHEDYNKQITELTRQREKLANEVATLEDKHKLLNPLVKDLEKREKDLSRHVNDMEKRAERAEKANAALNKESQRLLDIGLSLEEVTEFTQRVQSVAQHHHIAPSELRERLLFELENLDQGIGLETLIENRKSELKKQEQAIMEARRDSGSLKAVVSDLKREKESLEASIKTTQEKISKEIAKITPMAEAMINRLNAELQHWQSKIYMDIGKINNEAIEMGKELGRFQEILDSYKWLRDLLGLVRREENLEAVRVRSITLLVLRGAAVWLEQNKGNNPKLSFLKTHSDYLIGQLEQWQA